MFSFRKPVLLLVAAAGIVAAQPALTTIQDILYTADGMRFSGTMYITWNAFQAGDGTNVATANLTPDERKRFTRIVRDQIGY